MSYYLGIDIGATKTKLGLLNERYKIIKKRELETKSFPDKDSLILVLKENILKLTDNFRLKPKGIGIGVPGLVNPYQGVIYYLVNIPGWENVHLKKILENYFRIPVFIDNDVNLMALAELYCGRAKGKKNVVCMTLGTGVGGGLILGGKLYRGTSFSAGEIGHIPLDENGPRCNCGGISCLERYVGNRYIVERARREIKRRKIDSIIVHLIKDDFSKLTPEVLSIALKEKDPLAKEIWEDVGIKIGIVLSGVVNLLNPELIIVGGGIANVGKFLFDKINQTIKSRAMRIPREVVKVVPAKLRNNAGIVGAVVLAKEGIKGGLR